MTLEEAIRLLDPKTSGEAIAEIKYYNGFSGKTAAIQAITDACEIAVEAMGKRIQSKPIMKRRWENDHIICGKCLYCDSGVNNEMNYCSECGQKLDWSDEE